MAAAIETEYAALDPKPPPIGNEEDTVIFAPAKRLRGEEKSFRYDNEEVFFPR